MTGRSVLIVTGQHFATQPRRVDLHFIAEALTKSGRHVDFLSLRLSHLSRLIKDERWAFARTRPLNRWTAVSPMIDEFIWFNLVHPISFGRPALNRATGPVFRHYGRLLPKAVTERLQAYSHIVIESGIALLLFPQLRRLAPNAHFIYHAADRLGTIGTHPEAKRILEQQAGRFETIHIMAEAIAADLPPGTTTLYLPHGIDKDAFDGAQETPYKTARNAVSVGDMLFDAHAIATMARAFPDWTFHLFGRLARLPEPPGNVVTHGERPFGEIAAYIRHADIGIAPYRANHDADYISQSSLKMIQYTYCRLPIVAPHFAAAGRSHVFGYDPADEASISAAFSAASTSDRSLIDISGVRTWDEKTALLFGKPNLIPTTTKLQSHG
jgi:2-beta-glucuronyltransferase